MKIIKKLIQKIKNEINFRKSLHNFRKCRRKANQLHEQTGKRYHVVPGSNISFVVVDNSYVDLYNRQLPKAKRINIDTLLKMSYYSTAVKSCVR